MKRNSWSNQVRFEGTGSLICMCLALFLSVSTVTVAAQTVFEFEDPLADARAKIERAASGEEATPAPAVGEAVSSEPDASANERAEIKGPATVIAERLGLPTAGLFGLLALGILALLLGLMWLMGRRKAGATATRKDRELYAVADGTRARRTLESGAKVSRNRTAALDTSETKAEIASTAAAAPTAAAQAARILSDEPSDTVVTEETYGAAPKAEAARVAAEPTNPNDPATWQRPNLDRLKKSIRDDWKSSKTEEAEPEPEQSALRAEAENFASLFGDEADTAKPAGSKPSPVLDMLDTYEDDRDTMSVADLRAAVEKSTSASVDTGTVIRSESLPRPTEPSRNDALRRIKALRESVKAS